MKTSSRIKKTGKGGDHSFIRIPHFVLKSAEFGRLTPHEVKALIDLAKEYKGNNNGDLSLAFNEKSRERGWRSAGTLNKARRGLEWKGWTVCTRQGGSHRCSLYAITWWPLDDCAGKSMFAAELRPRNTWQKIGLGVLPEDRSVLLADSKPEKRAA